MKTKVSPVRQLKVGHDGDQCHSCHTPLAVMQCDRRALALARGSRAHCGSRRSSTPQPVSLWRWAFVTPTIVHERPHAAYLCCFNRSGRQRLTRPLRITINSNWLQHLAIVKPARALDNMAERQGCACSRCKEMSGADPKNTRLNMQLPGRPCESAEAWPNRSLRSQCRAERFGDVIVTEQVCR